MGPFYRIIKMKAMFIVFPLFIVVYYLIVPAIFGTAVNTVHILSFETGYQGLFIYIAVACSIILLVVSSRVLKKKPKVETAGV